jgi:hypothetical protein
VAAQLAASSVVPSSIELVTSLNRETVDIVSLCCLTGHTCFEAAIPLTAMLLLFSVRVTITTVGGPACRVNALWITSPRNSGFSITYWIEHLTKRSKHYQNVLNFGIPRTSASLTSKREDMSEIEPVKRLFCLAAFLH